MVNICVFQLAFAWIAALTSLHAILILTITVATQVYEVFHCFQLSFEASEVLLPIALPILLVLPLCLLQEE